MNEKIQKLRQRLAQLSQTMSALVAAAEARGESLTEDEQRQFDEADQGFKATEAEIARLERLEQVQAAVAAVPAPRVEPAIPPGGTVDDDPQASGRPPIKGKVVAHTFANHGFKAGPSEFYAAVRNASITGRTDPRLLVAAVTTWAGETVGADGGWALPPAFVQGIMSLVMPEGSLLRALNPYPTQSDLITIPTDEDAPWATDGIQANKTAAGAAITASKFKLKQPKIVMHGIKSLVHVDEKSLRDMAFLGAFVERKMAEKIRWKVENYVMNGTGENEPLGILNAPGKQALATSATASTATTLDPEDLGLMEATALSGPGGFWVVHPLVKAKVRFLKSGTNGYPLFTSDARDGRPVDQLLGYPLFQSEAAKPYDTEGDIIFVKPDGFFLAFESGGPQNATTIAFAFDQNLQSFRSTLHMGCAPLLSAPVLRADGTNYASHIVTLAGNRGS